MATEMNVKQNRLNVVRQQRIIAELEAMGHGTVMARRTLFALTETLRLSGLRLQEVKNEPEAEAS